MKKLKFVLAFFILVGLAACTPQGDKCPEVDFDKELSDIRLVLEQYELARESEDFTTVENTWAPDADIVLFGTEGDEQLVGFESIKKAMSKQFDEVENTLINISDQKIRINDQGTAAWFSEILDYNFIYLGENMSFEGIRFTGVLEKRDGKWKLVQGHLSVPYEAEFEEEAR
ncbi:MAG: nuclear transport factor 2 family protein [Bacteroidota bacterium]